MSLCSEWIVQNLGWCSCEEDGYLCCILSTLQQAWIGEQQLGFCWLRFGTLGRFQKL